MTTHQDALLLEIVPAVRFTLHAEVFRNSISDTTLEMDTRHVS